ncbi:hypothetical protein KJ765_01135 [Candidatus Micrarchaeota archaeon]|nr:hypothetical protein [Candidatus Micrarchaeota archaeon]
MEKRGLIGIAAVLLMIAMPAVNGTTFISECASDNYRTAQSDAVATGTIYHVESTVRESEMTVIRIEDVTFEKGGPEPTDLHITSMEFYVLGNENMRVAGFPELDANDIGKRVRVQLHKDFYGSYSLVCGEFGWAFLQLPQEPIVNERFEQAVELEAGWNLFSINPYVYRGIDCQENERCILIAGTALEVKENSCGNMRLWHYHPETNQYEHARLSELEYAHVQGLAHNPSNGYFAKVPNHCRVVFTGDEELQSMHGTQLQRGWNQIGAAYHSENAETLLRSCFVNAGPYDYDSNVKRWVRATAFEPEKAYFVKVAGECSLKQKEPDTTKKKLCEDSEGSWEKTCQSSDVKCTIYEWNCQCPETLSWSDRSGCVTTATHSGNDPSVTFDELMEAPWKHDGQGVCVEAVYGNGFEFSGLGQETIDRCTDSEPPECYYQLSEPVIWTSLSTITPLEVKIARAQGSYYQKAVSCGVFYYEPRGGFGHLGAYQYTIIAS